MQEFDVSNVVTRKPFQNTLERKEHLKEMNLM